MSVADMPIAELARAVRVAYVEPELVRRTLEAIPPSRFYGLSEAERLVEVEATACYEAQRFAPNSVEDRRYWWTSSVFVLGRYFARQGRCVHHVLRPAAIEVIAKTDLRDLPREAPRLLRGPWSLAASRGALFDTTTEIAGYVSAGALRLMGREEDGTVVATTWAPEWGDKFSFKLPRPPEPISKNPDAAIAWGERAARFVTALAILLEAEGTPFEPRDEVTSDAGRDARKAERKAAEWVTRHVYLNQARARVREGAAEVRPANTSGLVAERVEVRGHLRQQVCGPKRAERKWIYVAPFAATRWVREGDVRVVTHARGVEA